MSATSEKQETVQQALATMEQENRTVQAEKAREASAKALALKK